MTSYRERREAGEYLPKPEKPKVVKKKPAAKAAAKASPPAAAEPARG